MQRDTGATPARRYKIQEIFLCDTCSATGGTRNRVQLSWALSSFFSRGMRNCKLSPETSRHFPGDFHTRFQGKISRWHLKQNGPGERGAPEILQKFCLRNWPILSADFPMTPMEGTDRAGQEPPLDAHHPWMPGNP